MEFGPIAQGAGLQDTVNMAEDDKDKAIAEKAYEAAASSASEKAKAAAAEAQSAGPPAAAKPEAVRAVPVEGAPKTAPAVEAKPSAVKVDPKPAAAKPALSKPAAKVKAQPKPKVAKRAAKAKPVAPRPSPKAPVAPAAKVEPKPASLAAAKVASAKPAVAAPAKPVVAPAKPAVSATAQAAPAKPRDPVFKAAPKTADTKQPVFAGLFNNFLLEEKTMDMSANFSGIHEAMTEAQAKAKAAFEKGTSVLGEVTDFTKGNVEAVMESGKILADGIQGLGSELVAEGRATFENISGDIKDLAAAKSPTDFFKIQGDMMRKNFDSAVAYGAKNSETVLKFMSDAIAPISGRVSLAMEKARQTSL